MAALTPTEMATAALKSFLQNQPWSVSTVMRAGVVMAKALRVTSGTDAETCAVICKTLDTLLAEALAKVGESNATEAKLLAECKKCVETVLPVTLELTLDAASGSFDPAKAVAAAAPAAAAAVAAVAESGILAVVTKPSFWQSFFCRGPAAVVTEQLTAVVPAAAAAVAAAAVPAAAVVAAVPAAAAAAAAPVAAAPVAEPVADSTQTPPKESESQAKPEPSPEPLPTAVAP